MVPGQRCAQPPAGHRLPHAGHFRPVRLHVADVGVDGGRHHQRGWVGERDDAVFFIDLAGGDIAAPLRGFGTDADIDMGGFFRRDIRMECTRGQGQPRRGTEVLRVVGEHLHAFGKLEAGTDLRLEPIAVLDGDSAPHADSEVVEIGDAVVVAFDIQPLGAGFHREPVVEQASRVRHAGQAGQQLLRHHPGHLRLDLVNRDGRGRARRPGAHHADRIQRACFLCQGRQALCAGQPQGHRRPRVARAGGGEDGGDRGRQLIGIQARSHAIPPLETCGVLSGRTLLRDRLTPRMRRAVTITSAVPPQRRYGG